MADKPKRGQAGFDEFGNPEGGMFDLGGGDEARLRGERILLYVAFNPLEHRTTYGETFEWHHAQQAVRERQMDMDILEGPPSHACLIDERTLASYSQLWYVSSHCITLADHQVKLIADFVKRGNGLLLWADNDPWYADANLLARKLIGTEFSGDRYGDGIMVPGETLAPGRFIEHPLTQGINELYEGITICTVRPVSGLTILAQSHDKQYNMACYEQGNQRIVLDSGFTKLIEGRFTKTAGTARYFRNIAYWLARGAREVQYARFTPGREQLATIQPGGNSERYVYQVTQPSRLTYILHWQGTATLGLTVQDPRGHTVSDLVSSNPPIRPELPATMTGSWTCWVRGVNVPSRDFPYVLTLAVQAGAGAASKPGVAAPKQALAPASATKRLPVYLLLDTSARAGDSLPAVETAVRTLVGRLGSRRAGGAQAALCVVTAGGAGHVVAPMVEASRFSPAALTVRGGLMLGAALRELLAAVGRDRQGGDGKPLIFLVLGSAPSDDWAAQAGPLRRLAEQKQANVIAIALSGGADARMLTQLTPSAPLGLKSGGPGKVGALFEWIYQLADALLTGLERGAEGQALAIPPLPAGVQVLR